MDAAWWQSGGATFVLIALAELGDKSQFVCLMLAARYGRVLPVLLGAACAFALLNALAVLFGAALASWLPQSWVLATVAVLFAVFGVQSLLRAERDAEEVVDEIKGHSLFATTFLMIFLAEMGDKTQITVAGLAGVYPATAVWSGATVALIVTSAVGVLAGKTVLRRLPLRWLHRIAGLFFLALAALVVWQLLGL